jgi:PAS domain S-box/diguanylate cyclase (GGDEF) domain
VSEYNQQFENFPQQVLEVLGFSVVIIEAESHHIVYANERALKLFGRTREQLIGYNCHELLCPAESGKCPLDLGQCCDNSEREITRADGTRLTVIETVVSMEIGGRRYLLESLIDCSAQKKMQKKLQLVNRDLLSEIDKRVEIEERLKNLAYSDYLTGLPNKLSFLGHLNRAIIGASVTTDKLAVLFIDLDEFKMVNDTMGHAVGDRLLLEVADRLKKNLRGNDVIARLGGDEFVVLLERIQPEGLDGVAEHLLSSLRQPFQIKNREFFVTTSIGAAIFPNDGADADSLIKNADAAMYKAKAQGRNRWSLCAKTQKEYMENFQ